MTPRLALTAFFLAAACLARALPDPSGVADPVPAAAGGCKFKYVAEGSKDPGTALPKAECDFVTALEGDFRRLVAVTDLPKAVISPSIIIQPYFNAYAAEGGNVILNDKFVKKLIANRSAAVWVLAHEIGHLVQDQHGEGARRTLVWQACGGDANAKAWLDFNRVFESQADRIAGQLLSDARFPAQDAAAVEAALGEGGFQLSSTHTHPANGIRWLEALKHQEELDYSRYIENKKAIRRRARLVLLKPRWENDPNARADDDMRTPLEWANTDPGVAQYVDRPKFAPGTKLEQFDSQGRLPTSQVFPVFSKTEPAVPVTATELSVSDRLALRARTLGPQTSYVGAVWAGAYDWFLDGGFWRKREAPEPAKKGSKP